MNTVIQPVGSFAPIILAGRYTPQAITGSLPIMARMIARSAAVEVHIGGNDAWRRGNHVQLPDLPLQDPDLAVLAYGFLIHELGHVLFTEPVDIEWKLLHTVWNVFEDIRIERCIYVRYPGYKADLRALVRKLVATNWLERPKSGNPPETKLLQYLSYQLRAHLLEQEALQEYAALAEQICRASFPRGACVRIAAVMGRVPMLKSAADSLVFAQQVLDIIKDESQDPLSQDAKDAKRKKNLRDLLDSDGSLVGDLGQIASNALQEGAAGAQRNGAGRLSIATVFRPLDAPGIDPAAVLQEVDTATMALHTRLIGRVESLRYRPNGYRSFGHRIEQRRMVHLYCGGTKGFPRRRLQPAVNTAMFFLTDSSGSMNDRIELAGNASLAATAAVKRIPDVVAGAGAFPGHAGGVELLVDFNESVRTTAHYFRALRASGGTPLLPALLWAADQLMMRPERRKMIFVSTDGDPENVELCKETIEWCWRGGIEVYGIGIRVDVAHLFRHCCMIENLEDLAPSLFAMVQARLLEPEP